jgi:hypothetical protein
VNSVTVIFAGGARELAVADGVEARDVAVDRHVVGRVGEHHARALAPHQLSVGVTVTGICTQDRVLPEPPQIARTRDSWPLGVPRGEVVVRLRGEALHQEIDLGRLEADYAEVEVEIDRQESCSSSARSSLSQPASSASRLSAMT